jgi:hypothetical protein
VQTSNNEVEGISSELNALSFEDEPSFVSDFTGDRQEQADQYRLQVEMNLDSSLLLG